MRSPSGLAVTGLTKRFGKKLAVDGLSFEVARGEILALLGPNGAGKTTTLTCLAGLARPDAGDLLLDGSELGPQRGRYIALIPEVPEVYGMLTVWEHMVFVARSCRLTSGWEKRATTLLTRLQMAEHRDLLGDALSKGMKQRLLIASSVLASTPDLLLDEPMIGLDPAGQRELRQILIELRAAGIVIIVSTHLLQNVESFCDRLLILKNGQVVAVGGLSDLLAQYGGRSLEDTFLDIVG